jgi:predicted DNA-binding WGR domain protein
MATKNLKYAVDVWTLEYRSGSSDKFYQVFVSETGLCVLRWGRRGTSGQSSTTAYSSYDAARDQGLKQVFAKKSKGYSARYPDQKYLVSQDALNYAKNGQVSVLVREWELALREGTFEGAKQTVLKHYADFAERVQTLLHRASNEDFETLSQEFEGIEEVWQEITDKHAEVSAAMDLAKITLFQRMMSST